MPLFANENVSTRFDIPSLTASDALPLFGSQADVMVIYDYDDVSTQRLSALHGSYSLKSGLDIMLSNTSLTYELKKSGAIIVVKNSREKIMKLPTAKKNKIATAIAVPLAVMSANAAAQEKESAQNDPNYEVISITSQKRDEDVMTTPVTGDFLTAAGLERKKVIDLESLQFATPSLSITSAGITSNVNIRGIGLNVTSPDVVPGVAIYRDGLFQPPLMPAEPLFDMDTVEVLRGPQGTFTGASSTGGAIFFRGAAPQLDETSGSASLLLGSYDRVNFQGVLNAPVAENVAARIAVNFDERDSYFSLNGETAELYPGSPARTPGNKNQRNIRLGLLWEPTDSLSILSTTTFNRNNTDGFALIPNLLNESYSGVEYQLQYNTPDTQYDVEGFRQALEINYEFDNGVSLRSVSGYNHVEFMQVSDLDHSSLASNVLSNRGIEEVFTQEVNVISPDEADLTWVVGAFYMRDIPKIKLGVNQSPPPDVDARVKTTKTGKAIFGHVTYDISTSLEVEMGVRYTDSRSEKEGLTVLYNLAPFPIEVPQAASQSDDAVTAKFAVNWQASKEHYFYGFYAQGYKAGGVNSPGTPAFEPESVDDYELGVKSNWLGGSLRTQINAFWMEYEDMQLGTYLVPEPNTEFGGATGITNVGEATIKGLELQAQYYNQGFRFDLGVGLTDSEVGNTPYINPALLPGAGNIPLGPSCAAVGGDNCFDYSDATTNLAGVNNAYSPDLTVTLGAEYTFELADDSALVVRADYAYTDEQWASIQQSENDYLASRNIVNASLTYLYEDWSLEAFVTNLTDETYISGQDGTGWFLGRPREVAVKATYIF